MEKTTLEHVTVGIEWYKSLRADFQDPALLGNARLKLACYLFDFAGEVGQMYKEKNRLEYVRKSDFAKFKREALETGQKVSVAAAEAEAEAKTEHQRFEEQQADAEYHAARLIYSAAQNVLDAMNQQIATIKQEKRLEMNGQGSQAT